MTPTRSISLYFRAGTSDKQYDVRIEPAEGGFHVVGANCRRGGTPSFQPKTEAPVTFEEASIIFDKLVAKKLKDGYQPGGDAASGYVPPEMDAATAIAACQLAEPVDRSEIPRYVRNPQFGAQEKKDGERRRIHWTGTHLAATNRKGTAVPLPEAVAQFARTLRPCELDGEIVGEMYFAFDCLALGDEDLRSNPQAARYDALVEVLGFASATDPMQVVVMVTTESAKGDLAAQLEAAGAEGLVFKDLRAAYQPGRAASGNSWIKAKFVESASVRVAEGKRQAKRSVPIELLDGDSWRPVGNVTIPANHPVPPVGAIVEVQYLYAYPGGSLFQPVYQGDRSAELDEASCLLSQLKYKQGT